MTNREKYAEEILDIVCRGEGFAMRKDDKRLTACNEISCIDCCFNNDEGCDEATYKWAESEYIEPAKISKRDKAFLDYIRDAYNFVVRNREGKLLLDGSKPWKTNDGVWICISGNTYGLSCFDVKLPMVKREDTEPWRIEDLKALEVCDEY